MRTIAGTVLAILAVVVTFAVVSTALHLWAWRRRNPQALRLVKLYHKYVENPVMIRFSQFGITATIHHVGRRSGTQYATPVVAHQSGQDVIIPLPYGTDIDWLRNLLAAGQAVVDLDGRSLAVEEPAVVGIDEVIDLLPIPMIRTVRFNGAREALLLQISQPAPASI